MSLAHGQIQPKLPDSIVRPILPGYMSDWLDALPGYDGDEGLIEQLDMRRVLWEAEAYYPLLYSFPNNIVASGSGVGPNNLTNFAAGDTQTGTIQVPIGSFLVSISAYYLGLSSSGIGCSFRLYEKGAQSDFYYNTIASMFDGSSQGDFDAYYLNRANFDQPFGPYNLLSPLIVLPPGILQVEVTNLDNSNAATIQLLFAFACPINPVSMNAVSIEKNK
jgi:hypothetical protein